MSSPPSASASGGVSISPFGPADKSQTGPDAAQPSALRRKQRPHPSVGMPGPNRSGATRAPRSQAPCAGYEAANRAPIAAGSESGKRPGPQTTPAAAVRLAVVPSFARRRSVATRTRSCVCNTRVRLSVHAAAGGTTAVANTIAASAAASCAPETGERLMVWGISVPSSPASVPRCAQGCRCQTTVSGAARNTGRTRVW